MQGVCVNSFCGMKSSPVNRVFVASLELVVVEFSCHFLMRDQQQMVQHLVGILASGGRVEKTDSARSCKHVGV